MRILASFFLVSKVAILLTTADDAAGALLPKQASPDTPWDDLKAVLSSPDVLTPGSATEWKEQCVQIFEDIAAMVPEADGSFAAVSNYALMNQSSGLCLDNLSCAYEKCKWPPTSDAWPTYPPMTSPYLLFPGSNALSDADLELDTLLLPAMVLQPKSASDIVRAIEFCHENDIGITVKVAGHSYFGASTAKNTLLIKMNPSYPKYGIGGSLMECSIPVEGSMEMSAADQMACDVARARNKNAVMRVGGGELFDEAYRAVSIEWNAANPDRKYHLVGGGAGTVSAAGGWMASGGLSGTTGMRLYGIGIDQVVALEMVLPSGQHVRFAPTEWTEVEEGYPKTTTVSGFCNAQPYEADESLWDWTECNEGIDFNELWFAVRGGGGGTYGIVTSLHYQLHDYPGTMAFVGPDASGFPANVESLFTEESAYFFTTKYIEFLLTYLYKPEAINVTEVDSRGCNSAQTMNLNPFSGGFMFCYGTSASTILSKWKEFIADPVLVVQMQEVGLPDELIAAVPNLLVIFSEFESYAHQVIEASADNPLIPEGRLGDSPLAQVVPILGGFPSLVDSFHTFFPLEAIRFDTAGMAELLALDVLTTNGGTIYAQGGAIPSADDGLNSLSPSRRNAAFLMSVESEELRDLYYSFFYGTLDMAAGFPGSSCHNHALIYEMGPLKTNWSKTCSVDWPQEEREEKCISQNEAAWGTSVLARLEAFKAVIDPKNIFVCTSGVGYSNPVTSATAETEGPGNDEETTPDSGSPGNDEEMTADSGSPGLLLWFSLALATMMMVSGF